MANSKTQKLTVPICLEAGIRKKKTYYLNLNQYNTWHFQVKNQLKKLFKINIIKQVRQLTVINTKCKISYTIYYPTKRKFDLDNIGSIIAKFTHDVLTEVGIIEDDNYTIVTELLYRFGGVDKEHPRCEVTLLEEL
jgi:Holliday junction resolvase RusA-like endonuclease